MVIGLQALVIVVVATVFFLAGKRTGILDANTAAAGGGRNSAPPSRLIADGSIKPTKPTRPSAGDKTERLKASYEELIDRLRSNNSKLSGNELQSAQFELVHSAKNSLRGENVLHFLDELFASSSDNVFVYGVQMCAANILLGDPKLGVELVLKRDSSPTNQDLARAVGRNFIGWSTDDVAKILRDFDASPLRDAMVSGYLQSQSRSGRISSEDVQRFLALADMGLAKNSQINEALSNVAKDTDFRGVYNEVDSLDAGQRSAAVDSLIKGWSRENPASCAEFIKEKIAALPSESMEGTSEIAKQVQILMSNWAGTSPQQASEWLNTLPKGDIYDSGAGVFAIQLLNKSPESAIDYSESVTNLDLKRRLLDFSLARAKQLNDPALEARVAKSISLLPKDVSGGK